MTAADRLRAAVQRLDSALSEQARAVAAYRASLVALESAHRALVRTTVGYQTALARLRHDVETLGGQARALEATMDAAVRRAPPSLLSAGGPFRRLRLAV